MKTSIAPSEPDPHQRIREDSSTWLAPALHMAES